MQKIILTLAFVGTLLSMTPKPEEGPERFSASPAIEYTEDLAIIIGRQIRQVRQDRRWSVETLSHSLGIAQEQLLAIEAGELLADETVVYAVQSKLGCRLYTGE